jgi:hypothetical protein
MRVSLCYIGPSRANLPLACLLFRRGTRLPSSSRLVCKGVATSARERAADRLRETAGHLADKVDRNLFERYGDVQAFGLNDVVLERRALVRRTTQ